jgi:cytochrome b561
MQLKNTDDNYGLIAIILHWIMAILMIGLLALGLYMVRLPVSLEKLKLFGWHKEFGILVLALVIVRIIWRLGNTLPNLPATVPSWQQFAARAAHYVFYIFMLSLPLTGWMMSSASGLPVSFFGLITLPDLISANEQNRLLLIEIHKWLAYALIATLCLHIAASLEHHFIRKDVVLRRMLGL